MTRKVYTLLLILFMNAGYVMGESYFIEKEIKFNNGSYIQQVTKNTLVSTPNTVDTQSQIMKLHGQLLLQNGVVVGEGTKEIQAFLDNSITGMICAFASDTVPAGWLPCDGAEYSVTKNCEYLNLGDKIRNTWGGTSPPDIGGHFAGKFNVPDLRGLFLRGSDGSNVNDVSTRYKSAAFSGTSTTGASNTYGSYQLDAFTAHAAVHSLTTNPSGATAITGFGTLPAHTHTLSHIMSNPQHYDTDEDESTGFPMTAPGETYSGTPANQTLTDGQHIHTIRLQGTVGSSSPASTTSYPKYYVVVYGIRL